MILKIIKYAAIGYGLYAVKKKILNSDTKAISTPSKEIGKVVTSPGHPILYRIDWHGAKVAYVSYQAYINDGSREIITLTDAQIELIPEVTNAFYYETGYKQG